MLFIINSIVATIHQYLMLDALIQCLLPEHQPAGHAEVTTSRFTVCKTGHSAFAIVYKPLPPQVVVWTLKNRFLYWQGGTVRQAQAWCHMELDHIRFHHWLGPCPERPEHTSPWAKPGFD